MPWDICTQSLGKKLLGEEGIGSQDVSKDTGEELEKLKAK